jgi:AraC family transcriptional regulator
MSISGPTLNMRIDSLPGYEPLRSVAACRTDAAYELRLQDVQWLAPGKTTVLTGARCMLELLLPESTFEHQTEYTITGPRGQQRAVGSLNFVAPSNVLELQWSRGRARSVVCMFDPARLGLLGGLGWDWNDVDPMAAVDIHNVRLDATMRWLRDELLQPSFASELQITSMLTVLALELRSHFGASSEAVPSGPGRLGARQLAAVQDLIEQSPPEGVTLDVLGAACGLTGRELATLFKATVGMTLRSYVAASHIDKAKLLLSDPQLMIKQVAWRSGFESAAAFTAAFRKATGATPLQYRQHCGASATCD